MTSAKESHVAAIVTANVEATLRLRVIAMMMPVNTTVPTIAGTGPKNL